ncbi:hypothetical protein [Daejeonella sp.]|uniref:hypothetical protein n=1 Tax=Daejeonella sp. TaxID=2805397 RepID=UPI0030BCD9C3
MWARFILLIACLISINTANAQSGGRCPQNIGFESGTFENWKCYNGLVSVNRSISNSPFLDYSLSVSGPVPNQHTIIPRSNDLDNYGEFPLNSPNGSDYVIKLGNAEGGHGAERVSYTLEVPANIDAYSIIFNYAVVLQSPNHQPYEQPKFTVQIIDETTN